MKSRIENWFVIKSLLLSAKIAKAVNLIVIWLLFHLKYAKIYSYFLFSWSNTLKGAYPRLLRHNDETYCPKNLRSIQSPCFLLKLKTFLPYMARF